ncbi:MAG: orotidine-5'-phosphate decarboxylase [Peptococcaceae bacterium]|nr:orotidine-5'-phosphate decarboxylase [Peptococcaceae bacterium]
MHNRKRLIIALDMDEKQKALEMVDLLKSRVEVFKVGMELFYSSGGDIIKDIKNRGCKVFLDLKLHDIPNTVAKAARSLTRLNPDIINVHASGGPEMMKAAVAAIREEADRLSIPCPAIIAVTVLTSINQDIFTQLGIDGRVEDFVVKWAKLTKDCGLDGVVASPGEVSVIRDTCGPDFLVVTPGVRPDWAEVGDQKRFTTPAMAISSGATYIVVGRPVTSHPDPFLAAEKIINEIESAGSLG